ANSRYQAVDAASCCDHARQVVEDDGIAPVIGAKYELSAVLRLCAEDRIARAADAGRREVQVCPCREQELELHVEIATNEVANETSFTFGIIWRRLVVRWAVRDATADDAARVRLSHRECVARIQAADMRADWTAQAGCVVEVRRVFGTRPEVEV